MAWILVFAFFFKLCSKLIFALAFVPIGTLTKFCTAVLPISAISAALVYNSISTGIEIVAFVFHRRFTKISQEMIKSPQFQKLWKKLESWTQSQRDQTKAWVQILEIFFIQNAFGVPDTATMLYYAVLTEYFSFSFAIGTSISYFSITLLKSYAWMIALRALMRLGSYSYQDLSNLQSEFSPEERYTIIIAGSLGIAWIIFKMVRFCFNAWKFRRTQAPTFEQILEVHTQTNTEIKHE